MAQDFSFDVVSQFDRQELVNALQQTKHELDTRFDLRSTGSAVELGKDELTLASASEITLKAVREVLISKAVRRGIDPKVIQFGKVEPAAKGTVRQKATLQSGLTQDLAKEVVKIVRDAAPKVKAQIQGDAVRVSGRAKDDLQEAIKALKAKDFPRPLQFVNMR